MKKALLVSIINVAFIVLSFGQSNKTLPLQDVVKRIDTSYRYALSQIDATIELIEAEITFTLSNSITKGAGLNIWILKLGGKRETKKLSSVTFNLAKQDKEDKSSLIKADNAISALIINAARDFAAMNKAGSLSELNDRGFVVEAGLTITKTGSGSGEYEIGIFGVSAEMGKTKEQGHTIKLTFKKKIKNSVIKQYHDSDIIS